MIVCVPVSADGMVDPRWGRAERVAVARVGAAGIEDWQEFEVGWGGLHDAGPEGEHHARVARFLLDQKVELILVGHMGAGMALMVERMGIPVRSGVAGRAREAVEAETHS